MRLKSNELGKLRSECFTPPIQGKPLVCPLWPLKESRASALRNHGKLLQTRVWGITAQGQSPVHGLPYANNQPNVAPPHPPRPPPPPLDRPGDLPERLLRDYLSGWTSQYTEYDYYIPQEAVHGAIPEDIRGTLFLIGPGLTEVYGTSVRHPNDADGMVCSLAFGGGGQVFFRNRYVRTASFTAEQTLGRRVTRGFHDRGAPPTIGQQQQPQEHHHHSHQPQGQGQQDRGSLPSAAATRGPGLPSQPSHSGASGSGRSSGGPAGSSSNSSGRGAAWELNNSTSWGGWSEVEEALRSFTGGGGSGGNKGGAGGPDAARQAVAALATAAGEAVPRQFRLDPLVLLGLPPLPPLSSLFNPLDTSFRAPANASIVYWAGRLLAFTDGGSLPYELNKLSLETVGHYDAAGAMTDIGRLVGGYKIAPAPPQGIPGTGPRPHRLVLMGAAQSGGDTLLRWVELGEDGRPAGPPTTYRLPGCWAQGVLDFWVTDRHYVVVQAPLDFNAQRFATRATIGAASFAECFDWDSSRPSRIHLVTRPSGPPAGSAAAAAAGPGGRAGSAGRQRSGHPGADQRKGSGVPRNVVWPPPGPAAVVMDGPPLLPTSCVGCFTPAPGSGVVVLDALCQQGLTGSVGGTLDSLDPEDHRFQPKPELVRLVVDLTSRTLTSTRVLSQRTATAATTAASFPTAARAASPSRAPAPPAQQAPSAPASTAPSSATRAPAEPTNPTSSSSSSSVSLAPVGHGSSFLGGYHHLFAAASATDTSSGWAPSQVLVKLSLPPEDAVEKDPRSPQPTAVSGAGVSRPAGLSRRRGVGAEVWAPGDRVFVGPPVFIPRQASAAATTGSSSSSSTAPLASSSDDGGAAAAAIGSGELARAIGAAGTSSSPLPPLESEVEAAVQRTAAAAAARRQEEEQEGWLLVMVHDAATMAAELCILDARDVTRGPVAVVALPHHLPHARAAHFTRAYCGPGLAAPPGWRPRTATATAAGGNPNTVAPGAGKEAGTGPSGRG